MVVHAGLPVSIAYRTARSRYVGAYLQKTTLRSKLLLHLYGAGLTLRPKQFQLWTTSSYIVFYGGLLTSNGTGMI